MPGYKVIYEDETALYLAGRVVILMNELECYFSVERDIDRYIDM